uniref:Ribosome biogenesis protein BOP1 n=1 Tax=Esox lucius TaxID=8010 RepID=C1BZD3_ESOLU|nr:Ribosome biogenesis protein BOP1 [Esox lucius]
MPTVNLELQKKGTMSKAKEKSAKKRVAEEDDDQFPIFDKDIAEKENLEDEDDLSDSGESVFSGLEDSGSDSEEDGEGDEDGDDEDEDCAIISDEILKNDTVAETSAKPTATVKNTSKHQDEKLESAGKKNIKKGKGIVMEDGGEKGLTTTFQGLTTTLPADEYDQDTSDEEDVRNTVGNIPMEWYQDYPHIGYDLDGKKIFKPIRNKDELDEFLDKMENPDYW